MYPECNCSWTNACHCGHFSLDIGHCSTQMGREVFQVNLIGPGFSTMVRRVVLRMGVLPSTLSNFFMYYNYIIEFLIVCGNGGSISVKISLPHKLLGTPSIIIG